MNPTYKKKYRKKNKTKNKRKEYKKGRGPEDEVPFLLKKRLENQDIYEPGIISKILKDVPRNTVKAAISRKSLMDSYKQHIKEKKLEADSLKKKFKQNEERIKKINELLQDKKILQTDGPSNRTRSKSKSKQNNLYINLNSEKQELISENHSIKYNLNHRLKMYK